MIRRSAGWSVTKAAAFAEVSPTTLRIFEIDPSEVQNPKKRAASMRLYRGLCVCIGADAARA
jgi:hypothetical protein